MRKLTTILAAAAFAVSASAAYACTGAASADISKPKETAEAPISKPAQN